MAAPTSRDNTVKRAVCKRRDDVAAFATRYRFADQSVACQIRIDDRAALGIAYGAAKVRRRLFAGIASLATGASPAARAVSETASTDL